MSHTPGWLDSDTEEEEEFVLEEQPEGLGSMAPAPAPSPVDEGASKPPAADELEPFPWAACLLVCLINLINSASYMMTFPFVAFQIMSFFPGLETQDVGFYSGVLEASFHLGCIPGALLWSWVADTYGRRPALMYGLGGTALCCVGFGLAPNFACALAARFLWGLLNGNVGVAKTVMSELASDVHMARAFSYIGLNAGAGRVLGPALGGLLSEPAKRYPALTPQLLVTFPFLLPCIICGLLSLLTMLASYFVLKETLVKEGEEVLSSSQMPGPGLNGSGVLQEEDVVEIDEGASAAAAAAVSTSAAAAAAASSAAQSSDEEAESETLVASAAPAPAPAAPQREGAVASYLRLMRDPLVFGAVGLYCAMGSVGIVTQELFPLYAINGPERGGFQLTSRDLGLLNVAAGVPLLIYQLLCFPRLSKWLGVVGLQTQSLGYSGLILILTPALSLANGRLPRSSTLGLLYAQYIAATLVRVTGFVANFVLVANSAPAASDRARVCVECVHCALNAVAQLAAPPSCPLAARLHAHAHTRTHTHTHALHAPRNPAAAMVWGRPLSPLAAQCAPRWSRPSLPFPCRTPTWRWGRPLISA